MKQNAFLSCSVRNCVCVCAYINDVITVRTFIKEPKTPRYYSNSSTYPFIPELRESVDDDTKHDVQSNRRDDDKERDIIQQPDSIHCEALLRHKRDNLGDENNIT